MFPNSAIDAVHRAYSDYPAAKEGDVSIVEFMAAGIAGLGLSDGSTFKRNEAFSLHIATDYQDETDRDCNAIVGTGAWRVREAGARTSGVYSARSRRASCRKRWQQAAMKPNVRLTRLWT